MKKEFRFLDPGRLVDGDLELVLVMYEKGFRYLRRYRIELKTLLKKGGRRGEVEPPAPPRWRARGHGGEGEEEREEFAQPASPLSPKATPCRGKETNRLR